LAPGNTNPQGIADPPAPGSLLPTGRRALSASVSPPSADAGRQRLALAAALLQYEDELQSDRPDDKVSLAIPAIDLALAEVEV
jgi:hypothetical protein